MTDTSLTEQDAPFPEQAQLEDMVQQVIEQARKAGADGVDVLRCYLHWEL